MDLDFGNDNWSDANIFDDLRKFAEEHAELGLDLNDTAPPQPQINVPGRDDELLKLLEIDAPLQLSERTPPHQPICSVSPKPFRGNDDPIVINTVSDLTQQELQEILRNYVHTSEVQSGETLTVVDGHDIEEDNKTGLVMTESNLAEYFKVALSSPDGQIFQDQPQSKIFYRCTNCDEKFEELAFDEHICEFDENHKFIDEVHEESAIEHPCIKMLSDNNTIIKKLLKTHYRGNDKPDTVASIVTTGKKHDGPHSCLICDRKFVHATGLARHMERHEQDHRTAVAKAGAQQKNISSLSIVNKCLKCFRIFNRADDALNHLVDAHALPKDLDELDMTDDELFDANELKIAEEPQNTFATNPLQVLVLTSLLQCEFCEYVFSNLDALLLHEGAHDPRRGYECSMCEIHVPTLKEIGTHWAVECPYELYDENKNTDLQIFYVCNVCENKFQTLTELYEHRYSMFHLFPRVASDTKNILVGCEVCGELFDTAKAVIVHRADHQPKKAYKKEPAAAMAAVIDVASGTVAKYRQYLCDVCGKSYTQSSHLWQHLRFHKGVKPFACKEPNCLRRFTIRPDLNDHIRKCHTGERPYHCLICGKRFLTGSVFYQHRLIHRGERRYGCDDCGKRFYRADALKNHQRIHTGEKPYACTQCPKSFRQRGDRDKHIRARHSGPHVVKENSRPAKVSTLPPDGRIRCKKDLLIRGPPPGIKTPMGSMAADAKRPEVVYVGNMPFPTSMFLPMVTDIDA